MGRRVWSGSASPHTPRCCLLEGAVGEWDPAVLLGRLGTVTPVPRIAAVDLGLMHPESAPGGQSTDDEAPRGRAQPRVLVQNADLPWQVACVGRGHSYCRAAGRYR